MTLPVPNDTVGSGRPQEGRIEVPVLLLPSGLTGPGTRGPDGGTGLSSEGRTPHPIHSRPSGPSVSQHPTTPVGRTTRRRLRDRDVGRRSLLVVVPVGGPVPAGPVGWGANAAAEGPEGAGLPVAEVRLRDVTPARAEEGPVTRPGPDPPRASTLSPESDVRGQPRRRLPAPRTPRPRNLSGPHFRRTKPLHMCGDEAGVRRAERRRPRDTAVRPRPQSDREYHGSRSVPVE